MSAKERRSERHEVVLTIQFATADEFVVEYAENISAGGLFIRYCDPLEPLSLVRVIMDLPGFGKFEITAKVAHQLEPEVAEKYGRDPGAGLQIVKSPAGFDEALVSYLGRLGQRRDKTVLVSEEAAQERIKRAGYQTISTTSIASASEHIMGSDAVLALVAPAKAIPAVREALKPLPKSVPLIGVGPELLNELDKLL